MADVLEQFLGGSVTAPPKPTGGKTVASDVQSKRDQDALAIIQQELGAAQGRLASATDPQEKMRHQADIAALQREIARKSKTAIPATAAPAAQTQETPFVSKYQTPEAYAAKTNADKTISADVKKSMINRYTSGYPDAVAEERNAAKPPPTAAPAAQTQTTQAAPAAPSDPLEAFFTGKPIAAQPAAISPASTAGAGRGSYEGYSQAGEAGGKVKAAPITVQSAIDQPSTAVRQIFGNVLKKGFEARQQLGERTAGAIDTLYEALPATYGAVQQAIVRPFTTPQKAEELGKQAGQFIAPSQPLGKVLGITGKETYQQPLGGITQPIAEQVNKMFNAMGMTPEQISETLKSKFNVTLPPEDIRNMVVIGSAALPQAVKETGQVVGQVKPLISKAVQPLREMAKDIEIVRPGQLSKAEAQAQFEARQAPAGSAGAAAATNNPFAGKITGEETVRGQFPQIKLSKTPTDVPVNEQILRSQAVQEVMPGVGVRPGVVTGNENLLRNEHTKAKLDTPEGQLFKQQIANEQIALSKYAEDRVNATGASSTLINDEQRGGRINDVMYGTSQDDMASSSLTGYLNQAKKQIYDSAYEKVGNNKINSSHADTLFVDPQIRATFRADGTLDVLKGAKDLIELAKTVGFKLPDGTIAPPGSVAAFDAVRKSMNKLWKPEKANAIREINQAIDKDIAMVADPALYKLGDKVHQVEKTIFGSKGIKNLFGEVDANGVITSSTPLEKIPSKLNNLPKDQWRHVRDTLDELAKGRVRGAPDGLPPVPPELQQAAAAARAEIDGALAREVQKAGSDKMGVWNQNSANKTMNSLVGEKILETFPPDEVRKFHLLNTVGQIVPGIHSYEGAALQARRVGLIEGNLGKLGTGAGAAIGGAIGEAPGAAAGAYVGGQAGVRLSEKMAAKALTKEAIKAQKEMEKAKTLGQQTGKNKIQDLGK